MEISEKTLWDKCFESMSEDKYCSTTLERLNHIFHGYLLKEAAAYDRLMSGGQKTPKEVANIFGFPIAMDCYSSNHEFQHGSDWNWFTAKPFIDGENDCWSIKRGMWGRVPYGLLNGYKGSWQDSLTLPDGWEER